MKLFWQNRVLKPGFDGIYASHLYLFRLRTGVEVRERVRFYNTGIEQQPGLVVMAIPDRQGPTLDAEVKSVVVFFNVDKVEKVEALSDYVSVPLELHPVLQRSFADLVVKQTRYESRSGSFIIPPRTTAVPRLQHSITPRLQHSNTPSLHHSITPSLHHSTNPTLHLIPPGSRVPGCHRSLFARGPLCPGWWEQSEMRRATHSG
jgi:Domain of unknown function (DUF3372)